MIRSLALAALLGLIPALAQADSALDRIKDRGTVAIGIRINSTAFGSLDPRTNSYQGFNIDLAEEIGRRLGAKVELVSVEPANRIQFLQQGKVDLLVASLNDTPERRGQVAMVPTSYYASGGIALTRQDSGVAGWDDVRGKPVCASQGSIYARYLAEHHGAEIKAFKTSAEALETFKAGGCVASAHDDVLLYALVKDPAWQGYRLILPAVEVSDWKVAARKGQDDTVAALDAIIRDLHRSGRLIEIEKAWDITPSPALQALHDQLAQAQP
ncbi:transporter substrate-binding domain-containing protein [Inquilinus sp. NPDC058860]|uniref:transporter substrate-binding domain-containing protein n=1 Tax=Inquilinus sp. NPDC058860 TaxID=3346652 RepID=UPI0036ADF031